MRRAPIFFSAAAALVIPASIAWADPGHHGHEHMTEQVYGRPGEPAKAGRVVQVSMGEAEGGMAFSLEHLEVALGEQIQFILRNSCS